MGVMDLRRKVFYKWQVQCYYNGSDQWQRWFGCGKCHIMEPNFAPDPDGLTDWSNPYLFTGRTVDIVNVEWSVRYCLFCRGVAGKVGQECTRHDGRKEADYRKAERRNLE